MQEFAVVGLCQIREFCKFRDGREKLTALHVIASTLKSAVSSDSWRNLN